MGTLIDAGKKLLPDLLERLARSATFVGTKHETWALHQAYALAQKSNFSRAILQDCPPFLAVSKLPHLTWCDLGSPARVLGILETVKLQPRGWSRAEALEHGSFARPRSSAGSMSR